MRDKSQQGDALLLARFLSVTSLAQRFLPRIGIALLSAFGLAAFVATPLAAQTISADDSSSAISPFCQALLDNASLWGTGPDLLPALDVALAQGGDLNQLCDFYGELILPLNLLISTDEAIAQTLIEQGVDVNAQGGKGDTPLHYVSESVEIARSLIERGANVNAENYSGSTPLHNVFRQKSAAVMALLIEQGADVNARTPEGTTPLHFASTAEVTALLISKGADMNARSDQNWTPLHYAVSRPEVAVPMIQAGADLTIQNREGAAIHSPSLSPVVLQLMLDKGVDVNLRNQAGQTVLHTHRTNIELVEPLLLAGAAVNLQDNQGRTPLYDVNFEVAERLLEAGAELNVSDNLGRTPLHQAVIEEQSFAGRELVPLFLSQGADATVKDYQGETALDIAQRLGKSYIVEVFPADSALSAAETTEPEQQETVRRQVEDLLQSARGDLSVADSVAQLEEAAELARTIADVTLRDRLLQPIASTLIELNELDEAWAIAQSMNYETTPETPSYSKPLRPQLEVMLVGAYTQLGQTDRALLIAENAPPTVRSDYWQAAIGALAGRNLPVEAAVLLDRASADSAFDDFARQQMVNRISEVYIGAEQFAAAQAFLQQQSEADRVSGLYDIALWAGRSGQLETARAVANQIPEDYRAGMLVELAQIAQYQGQSALAKSLLDESQQLSSNRNNDWRRSFEMATILAETYAEIGETETARKILMAAEAAGAVQTDGSASGSFASDWVSAFAKIGAFDRAMQLVDKASAGQRHAARLNLATVYVDRGQYDLAVTVLSQIPGSALTPYLEDKQTLLVRIVEETLAKEQPSPAKRVAQVIENPLYSVPIWMRIAAFYREKQQPQAAIDVLDRTLASVLPLEKLNSAADRNASYEVSNAELLIAIAQEYWAVEQREQAIETAEAAIASIQNFQSNSQSALYGTHDLRAIANLGRDWEIPELQSLAVGEIEALLEAAATDENPLTGNSSSYELMSLVQLAYNPNQASTELFNRNLARLEKMLEQTLGNWRKSTLERLATLYVEIDRPDKARTAIEEILTLSASRSAEQNSYLYSQLANITLQNADLEAQLQILPRLSAAQHLEGLTNAIRRAASEDDTVRTMQYFDQLIQLSERSQTQGERDSLLRDVAHKFEDHAEGEFLRSKPPRTPATVALLTRIPQHMSEPYQRAVIWMTLLSDLPPTETAEASKALSAALKEIPSGYRKRNFLWLWVKDSLGNRNFDLATQIAYQLEGEYCRTALGWIESVRFATEG